MSEDRLHTTIRRAIGGDPAACVWIVDNADAVDEADIVAMAALLERQPTRLARARALARSSRDRQLVAIAGAYLGGQLDLVDALARDHLADYPDSLMVAWIASVSRCAAVRPE